MREFSICANVNAQQAPSGDPGIQQPTDTNSMATSRYAKLYLEPAGPGDARPTAMDILRENNLDKGGMSDKVMLITGTSSGLGLETAKTLAETGATLYVTARSIAKAKEVLADLISGPHASRIHILELDLASLQSVRQAAAEFKRRSSHLNVLIANAGIRQPPAGKTKDGFDEQFGTNHLAHFLLFHLLKDVMLASSTASFHSRVIAVSSQAHRQYPMDFDNLNPSPSKYDPVKAYSYSKLANVWMSNEIERRYGSQGLHAWSLHPGGIRTQLNKARLTWGYVYDVGMVVFKAGVKNAQRNLMSVEQGAATTVWAATAKELEGQGGKYLERCAVADAVEKGWGPLDPGHAPWAYDLEGAKKLWEMSMRMVGL
jgi:NAD(P)-dependent dehydrogenase (short-subunit alcohol dehydrogenase family)